MRSCKIAILLFYMDDENTYLLRQTVFESNIFVCFVALRPKSTAMVIAERSVHLTTLFPGQA